METVFGRTRSLLLSDTAYATEQSYRLTDDVKYTTDAQGYYAHLAADGSWPDLNYHTDAPSAWRPSWHLYRVMLLVREYHKNNDPKYLDAIHRTLKFWIANDFICTNWWQNQINVPYVYSTIMLMMDKDANATETDFLNNVLIKRVQQKKPVGQNKIWQHDIESRIALIHHNAGAFNTAIQNMQSVISVGVGEGIQPDYSFHQHGPMLQFGNYGLHFINSLLFWMKVTANTGFAFDADKQKMIFDYCSNGIRWSVFKGAMDITAIGRQSRPNSAVKRGQTLLDNFNLLKSFDNGDPCKYALDGLSDGCPINGNKAFWRSDYMVQLKGGHYAMSVKMHGPGVSKVESINGENMKGAFLADGVTLIQQSGKEYRDIQAVWNWAMLPGTTSDTTIKPYDREVFKTSNLGVFTGLISDGTIGATAMTYDRLGVKAHKSYFFVGDMMVCLGAGIESAHRKNLVTTVDQNYYTGKVVKSQANSPLLPWVWHNNTGYFFIDKNSKPVTTIKAQAGSWNTVDNAADKQMLSDSVFTLYQPQSTLDTYAYIVRPETDAKSMTKLAQSILVKVIKNTAEIQAIQSGNTLIATFYTPGLLQVTDYNIQPDKACMIVCKTIAGKQRVWVSDPSRTQLSVNLSINAKVKRVVLPQGALLGSSVEVN
ncbi:MAG: polysaccharide lyase family 8 super-sandwich domain-containing protein [Mucilaginibacter sp.]|uniref:polysaccharide lyase family 8 super-sandwich domain-containing protein n=1 Tax=Mucilaginibacter sp. TaxID=1882438 RepID=UPI003262E6C2